MQAEINFFNYDTMMNSRTWKVVNLNVLSHFLCDILDILSFCLVSY